MPARTEIDTEPVVVIGPLKLRKSPAAVGPLIVPPVKGSACTVMAPVRVDVPEVVVRYWMAPKPCPPLGRAMVMLLGRVIPPAMPRCVTFVLPVFAWRTTGPVPSALLAYASML